MINISGVPYEYAEDIGDDANGETLYVHQKGSPGITCTLVAGSNTGKFEFSTSSKAKLIAGTAIWQAWAKGTSTGTVSDVLLGPVTGLRGVSVSGAVSIEVVV